MTLPLHRPTRWLPNVSALIELKETDPRPAVHSETVWPYVNDDAFDQEQRIELLEKLAGAVLDHYGHPIPGEQNIDQALADAVRKYPIPEPLGCRWCGVPRDVHRVRYVPVHGGHVWIEPDQEQCDQRVRAHAYALMLEVNR